MESLAHAGQARSKHVRVLSHPFPARKAALPSILQPPGVGGGTGKALGLQAVRRKLEERRWSAAGATRAVD